MGKEGVRKEGKVEVTEGRKEERKKRKKLRNEKGKGGSKEIKMDFVKSSRSGNNCPFCLINIAKKKPASNKTVCAT